MKNPASRLVQLVLGFIIAIVAADAHAQLALKGKLLFQDNFKTPANYTSRPQPVAEGWTVQIRPLELEKDGR